MSCRTVKLAKPELVSHGGLTTITNYRMVAKQEDIVSSQFMHEKFNTSSGGTSMVVVTKSRLFSTIDDVSA